MQLLLAGFFPGLTPAIHKIMSNVWRSYLISTESLEYLRPPASGHLAQTEKSKLLSKYLEPENRALTSALTQSDLQRLTLDNLLHLNLDKPTNVAYLLFSPGNTQFYVGSTIRAMIKKRLREHVSEARTAKETSN